MNKNHKKKHKFYTDSPSWASRVMCLSMCLQGGSRQVTTGSFCEKNTVVSNFPHSPIGSIHKHRKKSACGAGSWNFPLKKKHFFLGGWHHVCDPSCKTPNVSHSSIPALCCDEYVPRWRARGLPRPHGIQFDFTPNMIQVLQLPAPGGMKGHPFLLGQQVTKKIYIMRYKLSWTSKKNNMFGCVWDLYFCFQ